jgi:hypothetical protein
MTIKTHRIDLYAFRGVSTRAGDRSLVCSQVPRVCNRVLKNGRSTPTAPKTSNHQSGSSYEYIHRTNLNVSTRSRNPSGQRRSGAFTCADVPNVQREGTYRKAQDFGAQIKAAILLRAVQLRSVADLNAAARPSRRNPGSWAELHRVGQTTSQQGERSCPPFAQPKLTPYAEELLRRAEAKVGGSGPSPKVPDFSGEPPCKHCAGTSPALTRIPNGLQCPKCGRLWTTGGYREEAA